MNLTKEQQEMLRVDRFPLSSKYDPQWVLENEMGPNALWLVEWLSEEMDLKPGMRVLDIGCGTAITSIFMAKEFGAQVWATDAGTNATENWQRIREAGVENLVFPIQVYAPDMPYAHEFFDAMVSIDAYHYFGRRDDCLAQIVKYIKPGGQLGIAVPGWVQEFDGEAPQHFYKWLSSPGEIGSFCTAEWWRWHWEKTKLVDIELADNLPDGWRYWLLFRESHEESVKRYVNEIASLRADQGRHMGFVRMVARRR